MAKKFTRCDDLTRHLYESSEQQRRHQQGNEADLHDDDEPAELGNEDFPPLNGVAGEDQNRDATPVPAPGTETEVVKGESSSASGNPDEPSEDPSINAAAAAPVNSDLDVSQAQDSATIESASTSAEHSTMITDPINLTFDELCRVFPLRNGVAGEDQNDSDARQPVPAQVPPAPGTETSQEVVKGESSSASGMSDSSSNAPCAENPSEQKMTSTPSNANAEEPSEDPTSTNAVEASKDPASTNAADAAAVNSDLDVGQVSATTECASTSTTMSGQEPHSMHNLLNPNPENPSEQHITSSSTSSNANADEPPEDPSSNAAAVNSDIEDDARGSTSKKRRLPIFEELCKRKE